MKKDSIFDEEKLPRITEADEVLCMDVKIQQFRDIVDSGDKEALSQIADLMGEGNSECIM